MPAVRPWGMSSTLVFRSRTSRIAGAGCLAVLMVALAGCSVISFNSAENAARRDLRADAEHAQDLVWHLRDELFEDAEGTLAGTGYIADLRPTLRDRSVPVPRGEYILVALADTDTEVAVTLASTAEGTVGGGWFTEDVKGAACYTLHLPRTRDELTTSDSDCTDGSNGALSDVWPGMPLLSFGSLGARASVDASDYYIPCQCSSGGECDCPGG